MRMTVTITSKRQLTIPRKLWDKLQLEGVRYLEADVQDGELRLKKVNFAKQMESFWQNTADSVNGSVSDASIKRAARSARKQKRI